MELAMIGLGRMGANMTRRLLKGGHSVAVYDLDPERGKALAREGAHALTSLEDIRKALSPHRFIWMMLPAGKAVDETLSVLERVLEKGDAVIDGGNTHYKDDLRRHDQAAQAGIDYMDIGVSGGVWGLEEGYCMMAGGKREIFEKIEPALKTLAPPEGYLYCGPSGAGHFVKMVHNGIEYAMMYAYGEGFAVLNASRYSERLDFEKIAHLWNRGSVIRSWLLELAEDAFKKDGRLENLTGYVEDSGEGRWTVEEAVETATPVPLMATSLFNRFASRGMAEFSNRLQAALRNEFGGHPVRKSTPEPEKMRG
jgi:6-phosphogluconate dehydrogenase